jgi:RNA polymerase-binding transcription factor DksA
MEKVRYSDAELDEFKLLILEKLAVARKAYDTLCEAMFQNTSNGTADTEPSFKLVENGETTFSKEEAGAMANRQYKFIKHLEAALQRIENKTYGICRETGKLIPADRLRAVPHTTLSVEAKSK